MKSVLTSIASKLGVALVLVATTTGVAAASASAELPQYRPEAAEKLTQGVGTLSIESPATEGFTGNVHCATSGEFSDMEEEGFWTSTFDVEMSFKECALIGTSSFCTGSGGKYGEIRTPFMQARLVYLSKATKEVGLLFNYTKSGEPATLFTFGCTYAGLSHKFTVRGTALAQVTPINVKRRGKFTETLTGAKGIPTLSHYETQAGVKGTAKLEMKRDGGPWEAADLNATGLKFQIADEVAEIAA
jgi:hypothetical protein